MILSSSSNFSCWIFIFLVFPPQIIPIEEDAADEGGSKDLNQRSLEMPKSPTRATMSSSRRMFWGFKSQWTMGDGQSTCKYSRAVATSTIMSNLWKMFREQSVE